MLHKIHAREDILTSVLFIMIGLTVFIGSFGLPIGSIDNFGPGMFPLLLGGLLFIIGTGLGIRTLLYRSLAVSSSNTTGGWSSLRGLIFIPLACIVFGVIIPHVGLFIASAVAAFLATRSDKAYSLVTALILSLCVAALVCAIFVYGIGLPIPVFPRLTF